MATRSLIAVKVGNNKYKTVYCHWNGHPSCNGIYLHHIYNTKEKALALIEGGDMSYFAKSLDSRAYHGENFPAATYTENDLLAQADHCGAEYVYALHNDGWRCLATRFAYEESDHKFHAMSEIIERFSPRERYIAANILNED